MRPLRRAHSSYGFIPKCDGWLQPSAMHEGSPSSTGRATTTSATVQGRSGAFRVRPVFSYIRSHHTQATGGLPIRPHPVLRGLRFTHVLPLQAARSPKTPTKHKKRYSGGPGPTPKIPTTSWVRPAAPFFTGFIRSTAVPIWPPIIHDTRPNSGGPVHQANRACGLQPAAHRPPAARPAVPTFIRHLTDATQHSFGRAEEQRRTHEVHENQ